MRKWLLLVVAIVTIGLAGCFRHTYYVAGVPAESRPTEWRWHHHFLWGIVNLSPAVPLNHICPQGLARVENFVGPAQAILSWLTSGIYTPTTVQVYCRAATVPVEVRVELDPETLAGLRESCPHLEELLLAARDALTGPHEALAESRDPSGE